MRGIFFAHVKACKVCKVCKKSKPLNKFNRYYNGREARRTVCMSCQYLAVNSSQRARRIEAFKRFGERCEDCGLKSSKDNYVVFDFHHLDPSKKEFSFKSGKYISDKNFFRELKKCVMLCSNCHRLRHFEERRLKNPERYA